MSNTWFVVRFTDEDTVEMVPSNWYEKNTSSCHWPPLFTSKKEVRTALQNRKSPEDGWNEYPAKILGQYDDIKTAYKKAAKARDTDILTSTASEAVSSKRKRKVKIRRYSSSSLSSSSESEVVYPAPPKKQMPMTTLADIGAQDYVNKPSISKSSQASNFTSTDSTLTCESTSLIQLTTPSRSTINEDFQTQILRQILLINAKLDQHTENFATLLKSTNRNVDQDERVPKRIQNLMPLQNEENIAFVENYLDGNEENINILANELSQIGGDTVKEITKRILYHLLTNKAGMLYSWEGAKGKKRFRDLKLADVILKAVRFNRRTKDAANDEIVKIVKAWLVRAKDRFNNERNNADKVD